MCVLVLLLVTVFFFHSFFLLIEICSPSKPFYYSLWIEFQCQFKHFYWLCIEELFLSTKTYKTIEQYKWILTSQHTHTHNIEFHFRLMECDIDRNLFCYAWNILLQLSDFIYYRTAKLWTHVHIAHHITPHHLTTKSMMTIISVFITCSYWFGNGRVTHF